MKKEKHLITPDRHVLRKHQEGDCALETLEGLEVGENQNLGMSGDKLWKASGGLLCDSSPRQIVPHCLHRPLTLLVQLYGLYVENPILIGILI